MATASPPTVKPPQAEREDGQLAHVTGGFSRPNRRQNRMARCCAYHWRFARFLLRRRFRFPSGIGPASKLDCLLPLRHSWSNTEKMRQGMAEPVRLKVMRAPRRAKCLPRWQPFFARISRFPVANPGCLTISVCPAFRVPVEIVSRDAANMERNTLPVRDLRPPQSELRRDSN